MHFFPNFNIILEFTRYLTFTSLVFIRHTENILKAQLCSKNITAFELSAALYIKTDLHGCDELCLYRAEECC